MTRSGILALALGISFAMWAQQATRRMADGKQWTARNLNVPTAGSYCYDDVEANCGKYGRLYEWESAGPACRSLGEGWHLPSEAEWRELARRYGGAYQDEGDGKDAYRALLAGGDSGFGILLGGGRGPDGEYARLEAHGFYWTASENGSGSAWFYNFGKGGLTLYRQRDGETPRAFSVRCTKR